MRREFCVPSSVATLAAWPSSPEMVARAMRDQWAFTREGGGKSIHFPEVQLVSRASERRERESWARRGVNWMGVISMNWW